MPWILWSCSTYRSCCHCCCWQNNGPESWRSWRGQEAIPWCQSNLWRLIPFLPDRKPLSSESIDAFLELVLPSGPGTEHGLRNITSQQLTRLCWQPDFYGSSASKQHTAYLHKMENERLEEMSFCKLMVSYAILCRAGINLESDRGNLDV